MANPRIKQTLHCTVSSTDELEGKTSILYEGPAFLEEGMLWYTQPGQTQTQGTRVTLQEKGLLIERFGENTLTLDLKEDSTSEVLIPSPYGELQLCATLHRLWIQETVWICEYSLIQEGNPLHHVTIQWKLREATDE